MLKKDLIDEVTAKMDGFLKKDVGKAVDILLGTIVEAKDGLRSLSDTHHRHEDETHDPEYDSEGRY